MPRLTFRQMQYFERLAETLHFGRAAAAAGVTQPALSAQIAEMEAQLGCRLFERGGGAVRLTSEARELRPRIQRILAEVEDLEQVARRGRRVLGDHFRLGVIPTVAPYLLPLLLPSLKVRFPALRLEVREAVTDTLIEETARGRLDGMIAAKPLEEPRLRCETLFEDRFFLAVPEAEAERIAPPVAQESMALERLLQLEEGHCMRNQALAICGMVKPGTMASFGATSLATLLHMVSHGLGVTLIPEIGREPAELLPGLRVLPFADPAPLAHLVPCLAQDKPTTGRFLRSGGYAQGIRSAAEIVRTKNCSKKNVCNPPSSGWRDCLRVKGVGFLAGTRNCGMIRIMKAYLAEVFGTFCLVFIGCASVVIGGFGELIPSGGALGIAMAFGIAVVAMAYAVGPVSGAHLNPAVTLGVYLAGRLPAKDVAPYMAAQVVGGVLGALVLWIIASGAAAGAPASLGANGWSAYSTSAAFIAEVVATFIFVMVILGVTSNKHTTVMAGLVIGLTLTAIHICLIAVTGTSVNPARSIGPALFSGGAAMAQLWLFIVAPLIGGAAAGLLYKAGVFESIDTGVVKQAEA